MVPSQPRAGPDQCGVSTVVQLTVRDALNSALDEEMTRDPAVYILGEEVRWISRVLLLLLQGQLLQPPAHRCRM